MSQCRDPYRPKKIRTSEIMYGRTRGTGTTRRLTSLRTGGTERGRDVYGEESVRSGVGLGRGRT